MDTLNKIIVIVCSCIACAIIGYLVGIKHSSDIDSKHIVLQDTTYNHVVLDSIELRIRQKDSVINRLKVKYEYDIKKVESLSDSGSVELFKRLCGE